MKFGAGMTGWPIIHIEGSEIIISNIKINYVRPTKPQISLRIRTV